MAKKITKQEAVRRALDHFGRDAKPRQMKPWIKQELGIEISTDHISNAKSSVLKAKPAAKASAAKAAPQAMQAKREVVPTPAAPGKATPIALQDILYVKELVGRVGPEQLHTLIDAFAN